MDIDPRTVRQSPETEAVDLALYNLALQMRFFIDLLLPMTPQTLQIESERLAAVFAGFADRLDAARQLAHLSACTPEPCQRAEQ